MIQHNLQELRDCSVVMEWLKAGKCTMQPHSLSESMSKPVGYLIGKDPRHTNKQELQARITQHLHSLQDMRAVNIQVIEPYVSMLGWYNTKVQIVDF